MIELGNTTFQVSFNKMTKGQISKNEMMVRKKN